jgi:hypothetical protein
MPAATNSRKILEDGGGFILINFVDEIAKRK